MKKKVGEIIADKPILQRGQIENILSFEDCTVCH